MIEFFKKHYISLEERYPTHSKITRFVISGGTGAIVNFGSLFIMVHFLNFWYVIATALSFLMALGVSFTLQKYWTYKDRAIDMVHMQLGWYTAIALFNLALNVGSVFVLVDYLNFHYLSANILSSGLIAVWSYYAYKKWVFKV